MVKKEQSLLAQYAESLHTPMNRHTHTRVIDLAERQRATVIGSIGSILLRPRSGILALEVEIEDGSGLLVSIWLGRRTIEGLTPGRDLQVTGTMIKTASGWLTYNPIYTLHPNSK